MSETSPPPDHDDAQASAQRCAEALVRVLPRIGRVYRSRIGHALLSPQQMLMLGGIHEGARPGDLSRYCTLSGPATTAALDDLVDAGYCTRAHGETDRRVVVVRLTERGRLALDESRAAAAEALGELLAGWDEARMRQLLQVLEDLDAASS